MKEEGKQEGHRMDFQISLPTRDARAVMRNRALKIMRKATRASQQAAMALAWLEANTEETDELALEGLKVALDCLEAATETGAAIRREGAE